MDTQSCQNCSAEFGVREEDLEFLNTFQAPAPTLCPLCREQRRLAFRNELNFFQRNCDLCSKEVISIHSEEKGVPVFCYDCWWGDGWDAHDYGRDVDFSSPFFPQVAELEREVPHLALFQDGLSENCSYINYGMENKDCYLSLCTNCQSVLYSNFLYKSSNCLDCTRCTLCQLCYECVDCSNCYELLFSRDCYACSSSTFLANCNNCRNCFASINLSHKQFVFRNVQLSEEDYHKRMSKLKWSHSQIEENAEDLQQELSDSVHRYYQGSKLENSIGNYLSNSKNCYFCFNSLDLHDCSYIGSAIHSKDIHDCTSMAASQLCYECTGCANCYNCFGIDYGRTLRDCVYCHACFSSANLFGCSYIKNAKYAVLNKTYSEEEYDVLVERLISHMQETGEWGEFFPLEDSVFEYGDSVANQLFRMVEEDYSSKPFKIIEQEEEFYERFSLPHPNEHPTARHLRRIKMRLPQQLWLRNCDNCSKEIWTPFRPSRPETIYCEECYRAWRQ